MFYVLLTEASSGQLAYEPEYYDDQQRALYAASEVERDRPDCHVDVWLNTDDDGLSEMIDGTGKLVYCSREADD